VTGLQFTQLLREHGERVRTFTSPTLGELPGVLVLCLLKGWVYRALATGMPQALRESARDIMLWGMP
jgi:hypothetical protein